jgi:hypothetical protein
MSGINPELPSGFTGIALKARSVEELMYIIPPTTTEIA